MSWLSQISIKGRIKFLAEYGKFYSEWVISIAWGDKSKFHFQRNVFEDLVLNTTVNASLAQ